MIGGRSLLFDKRFSSTRRKRKTTTKKNVTQKSNEEEEEEDDDEKRKAKRFGFCLVSFAFFGCRQTLCVDILLFLFFFWWLLLHLIDSRLWLVARGRVGGAHLIEIEMWLGSCSYSNLLFKKNQTKKLSLIYSAAIWLHPLHRGSCVVVFFWWKKM